jgi:hypothetical protein
MPGEVKFDNQEGWWVNNSCGRNSAYFDAIGVDKREYTKGISTGRGEFPCIKKDEDFEKLIDRMNADWESSNRKYKAGSEIVLCGMPGYVWFDDREGWWVNNSFRRNSAYFDVLGVDKLEYTKGISSGSGAFPYIKKYEDFEKLIDRMNADWESRNRKYKPDQDIMLCGMSGTVVQAELGWWVHNDNGCNYAYFDAIGVDKLEYTNGISDGQGDFPCIKKYEDFEKLIDRMNADWESKNRKYKPDQEITLCGMPGTVVQAELGWYVKHWSWNNSSYFDALGVDKLEYTKGISNGRGGFPYVAKYEDFEKLIDRMNADWESGNRKYKAGSEIVLCGIPGDVRFDNRAGWWVNNDNGRNSVYFAAIGVDKREYTKGISSVPGVFPYIKKYEDFEKLIDRMNADWEAASSANRRTPPPESTQLVKVVIYKYDGSRHELEVPIGEIQATIDKYTA